MLSIILKKPLYAYRKERLFWLFNQFLYQGLLWDFQDVGLQT